MDRRRFIFGVTGASVTGLAGCIGDANDDHTEPPADDDEPDSGVNDGTQDDTDPENDVDEEDDADAAPDIDITDVEFGGFGELDVTFTLHNNGDEEITIDTWFVFYDGETEIEEWSSLMDVSANDTREERIPNIIDEDDADEVTHIHVFGAVRVDDDWERPVDREYDASVFDERYEDVLEINGLEIIEHEFIDTGNERIEGVVENNAGETYDSVAVRVIVFDSDRDPIGSAVVDDTSNLEDGESWEFSVLLGGDQSDGLEDYRIRLLAESPFD